MTVLYIQRYDEVSRTRTDQGEHIMSVDLIAPPVTLADLVGRVVTIESRHSGTFTGTFAGWAASGGYHGIVVLDDGRHFRWSNASLVNDDDVIRETVLDHADASQGE